MGDKKRKSKPDAADGIAGEATAPPSVFLSENAPLDPLLAGLFASSAGPVKAPQINRITVRSTQSKREATDVEEDASGDDAEDDEGEQENDDEDEEMEDASDVEESSEETAAASIAQTGAENARKRKRAPPEDALEDAYMKKIAKEEAKEEKQRRAEKAAKRQKVGAEAEEDAAESENEDASEKDSDEESDEDDFVPPAHESLTSAATDDVKEKSNRTVFLGNVSNEAIKSKSAKKTLITHLSSFLTTLKETPASRDGKTTPHKVESIRFRSTAFSTTKGPKRAAFAKRELMDATTHSTNAYVVYSSAVAARKAPAALNGTIVLGRHLRVDSVAHPAATDNKRCVFVGNLGFVDEEQDDEEEGRKKKKPAVPADVEEGLWRTFNAHTGNGAGGSKSNQTVESVRVIRDSTTRIGKGFAYVQFKDENCVEQALLLDGKKFPPLLPRKLRVTRAKKMTKKNFSDSKGPANAANRTPLGGRASKLLGKAGAAGFRSGRGRDGPPAAATTSSEPFIFEGHRATADNKLKFKSKSRGSKGKPKTRSSRRAAAYKAKGAWKANKK